ncbi:MAG: NUDIX domain-containing protein [Nanoarchaeota archaeon]|nr:NUDIX domain-containing protein [Nanoarchaeota archaeon]
MEFLDIVNKNDEVIGKEERNKAHEKHLLHRAVIIIIANDKRQILLQLRKSTKKQYPLFWAGSVNGHISSGETSIKAAKKEMKEELGIETKFEFVDKFIIDNEVEHEMVTIFYAKSNGPFKIDKSESEKVEFIDVGKLRAHDLKMTPHCKKALQLVLKKYF